MSPGRPPAAALAVLVTVALLVAGCAGSGTSTVTSSPATPPASRVTGTRLSASSNPQPSRLPSSQPSQRSPSGSTTGRPTPRVTKLLVFVVENHSFDQMRAQMPWTFRLSETYGYATDYTALRHPSLPNYLGIAGGSTFGVADDGPPAAHPLHGTSVFGQALAVGKTAAVYAEGMPRPCAAVDGGQRYVVRHNPWTYFVDERDACLAHDLPLTGFAGDVADGHLPNAGLVVPDACHDGHDCDLAVTDAWMREHVGLAMSGPDWKAGRLAIVITADEDNRLSGNRVLTTVAHPSLHGVVVDRPLTHYSLTRLYDEVLGAVPLRGAAGAPSLAHEFGLPVPAS